MFLYINTWRYTGEEIKVRTIARREYRPNPSTRVSAGADNILSVSRR